MVGLLEQSMAHKGDSESGVSGVVLSVDKGDLAFLVSSSDSAVSTCDYMCSGGASCGSSCGRCGNCSCGGGDDFSYAGQSLMYGF